MITQTSKYILYSFLAASSLGFSACGDKEDDDTTGGSTTEYNSKGVSNSLNADAVVQESLIIFQDAKDGNLDGKGRYDACGTINKATNGVEIDFGSGCQGQDGVTRKGKITFSYTLSDNKITAVAVSYNNYESRGYAISGAIGISNMEILPAKASYTVSSSGLTVKKVADSKQFSISSMNRAFEHTLGSSGNLEDSQTKMTGNISGTTEEGKSFTSEIKESVILKGSCVKQGIYFPSSGKTNIKISGSPDASVNYGSGSCDNKAVVTVNGKDYNIEL